MKKQPFTAQNTPSGLVTDPAAYLKNTVDKNTDSYTCVKYKAIQGVGNSTCGELGGHNNCTLVSMLNILTYYRKKGYSGVPSERQALYSIIKDQAEQFGYYYEKNKGIPVFRNDAFVTAVWRAGLGYSSGSGSSRYIRTKETALQELDAGRPFLLSLASGRYFDHTVTVFGYRNYRSDRTGRFYTFLQLKDGWSSSVRFLPWMNTGEVQVVCLTKVIPPTEKALSRIKNMNLDA